MGPDDQRPAGRNALRSRPWNALSRLLARGGEPLIRKGVDLAMRLLGQQFVTGQTIEEALERARPLEARGYRYSCTTCSAKRR